MNFPPLLIAEARLADAGDRDYRRVLDHMRHYAESQAVYADFGDLNQGRSGIPSSPKP